MLTGMTLASILVTTPSMSVLAYDITPHGYGQGTLVDANNVPTGAIMFNETYCSLSSIKVGTHEPHPTECQCVDCNSFELK